MGRFKIVAIAGSLGKAQGGRSLLRGQVIGIPPQKHTHTHMYLQGLLKRVSSGGPKEVKSLIKTEIQKCTAH